jgi:hypothetical protein
MFAMRMVALRGNNILNLNVVFLAYRDWALEVYNSVSGNPKVNQIVLCKTTEELSKINLDKYDLLISVGWSDELGENIVSKIKAIGVHCAELDRYSYGTPIQLQILDGVYRTKHRIFNFTFDSNSKRAHTHDRLYSHEVDLDLSGNMEDILYQMASTSKVLFNRYIDDYPNILWKEWPEEKIVREKRKPLDSRLSKQEVLKMTTIELYDFFRCLEEPYPNGYIEDEHGKLYIKNVGFKKS